MAVITGLEEEDPLRRTLSAPPIVPGREEPQPVRPRPVYAGRQETPPVPVGYDLPRPDASAPGQAPQRQGPPQAGGAVVSAALPPPLTPEEEARAAEVHAQRRINQELAEEATKWANPLSKLGQGYGKMARLLAFQRNPSMDPETGRAIAKVTDVARGAITAPVSADELELYRTGTERGKAHITTATRQEDRNRDRVLRQADIELTSGTRKIQEAVAANPTMTPTEWANLVDTSFTNLTKGVGMVQASQIMPERIRAQMTTDADIDAANLPIYKQWLAQEGVDPTEQERLVSKMQDGGEGQARYEEFKATEGSMAFYRTPATQTDSRGRVTYGIAQQTISADKLKAKAEARALRESRTKLADLAAELDPTNKAETTVMQESGASKAALRVAEELKTAPDVSKELVEEVKGTPIVVSRSPDSSRVIATRVYSKLKDSEKLTVEQAIEAEISKAINEGIVTAPEGITPRQVYINLRNEIKPQVADLNRTELQATRQQIREAQASALERMNTQLARVAKTWNPTEGEKIGLAAGMTRAPEANERARDYLFGQFAGLPDMEREYLERGVEAAIEMPQLAAERYGPVNEAFRTIRDSIMAGYQNIVGSEYRAERNQARDEVEQKAAEQQRIDANAQLGLVTRWDRSGATPREVTFNNEDEAMAWERMDSEGKAIVEAQSEITRKRVINSAIRRDELVENLDAGVGWSGRSANKDIQEQIVDIDRRLAKATKDSAKQKFQEELTRLRAAAAYVPSQQVVLSQLDPNELVDYYTQMETTVTDLSSFDVLTPQDRAVVLKKIQAQKAKAQQEVARNELNLKKLVFKQDQELRDVMAGSPVEGE